MKRLAIFSAFILLTVLLVTGCTTSATPTTTTTTTTAAGEPFTSHDYGFSMTLPGGWYFEGEATVMETDMLYFFQGIPPDQGGENVNAYYIAVETPTLWQLELERANIINEFIDAMRAYYPDIGLVDSYTSTVAGCTSLTVIYTFDVLEGMQVHLYTDGRCYIFTYTAYQATFDTYLPDFEVMFNSFLRL